MNVEINITTPGKTNEISAEYVLLAFYLAVNIYPTANWGLWKLSFKLSFYLNLLPQVECDIRSIFKRI